MRCYPFAIMALYNEDYETYLEMDCRLTNPSTVVIKGIKRYIRSIIKALHGHNKEDILSLYHFPEPPPDITHQKGWFEHALYCSYLSLRESHDYDSGIKLVISLGGDTDTNAHIAGALLGAYYGYDLMSQNTEFSDNLEIILERDPNSGDFPRPEEYGPSTVKNIIEHFR